MSTTTNTIGVHRVKILMAQRAVNGPSIAGANGWTSRTDVSPTPFVEEVVICYHAFSLYIILVVLVRNCTDVHE